MQFEERILTGDSHRAARHTALMVFAGIGVMLAGILTAFGTSMDTVLHQVTQSEVIEPTSIFGLSSEPTPAELVQREVSIRSGDSVHGLFVRLGLSDPDALAFLQSDKTASQIFRQLVPGRQVSVSISLLGELQALSFPLNGGGTSIEVLRTQDGLKASTQKLAPERQIVMQTAVIRHSLFGAADDAGIPESVATRLADIFGGDIDFHRDLRKGDRFSVIYETLAYKGRVVRSERILAAEFVNGGKKYRAFWYEGKDGGGGYYGDDGKNIKKAFLRSPLEFSRITSGFSNARFHPVLQEVRAHRGIDYGAPKGTRVKVTGDGVVEFAGVQGGYGNVVMVRHGGNQLTVYGHLSGFAQGIRKGTRVGQGDVIGFVGATGLASGPHLHYEFRVAGVHRNPLTVALPSAPPLSQSSLADFRSLASELVTQLNSISEMQLVLLD